MGQRPMASVFRKKVATVPDRFTGFPLACRMLYGPYMEMYPRPRLSSFQTGQRSLVAFFHSGLVSALLVLGQPKHSLASFFEMAWTRHVKRIAAFIRRSRPMFVCRLFSKPDTGYSPIPKL